MRRTGAKAIVAGGLLVLVAGVAPGQTSTFGSMGSSGTSGASGSSFGSSGSAAGTGSTSNAGFQGVTFGAANSTGTAGGTSTYGNTSFFGRYYGNPLYNGLVSGQGSNSSSNASKYLRPPPTQLSFGNMLYNTANVSRSANQGTPGAGTTGAAISTQPYSGATSAGIRRSPGYTTEPVFDMPPRPSMATLRPDLQNVVSRASRLPSRDNIRVLSEGDSIILRGQVRDERERRLAEAVIRLTPGIRVVRNELVPLKK